MSIRTIIEINHDYLRRFKPEQFRELLYALGSSSVTELLNRGGGKPIDWTSGIRILGQRHHSEPEWQQMSEQDEATSLERRATAKFANCKWCGLERENAGPAKGCPTGYRCAHLNAEESKAMHDNPELFEARRRVSRLLADRGIYLYHTTVDEIVAAARGVTTARPVPDSVEHYGLIDERSPQGQAQAAALGVAPSPAPSLWPVIQWLEGGCDPKEAAKELRLYAERMGQPAPGVLASPHVNPLCGVHGPIPCEGARCICGKEGGRG